MNQPNQYRSPQSNVETSNPEIYSEVRFFNLSGRLGRVRYLAYTFGFILLGYIISTIISMAVVIATPNNPASAFLAGIITLVIMLGVFALYFIFTIQRSHDFNVSGWLSLLTLIPLGILIFLFVPGTKEKNTYGNPPKPNGIGVIIMAALAPFIFTAIIGTLAAIAIPAYNGYIEKAKQAQQLER